MNGIIKIIMSCIRIDHRETELIQILKSKEENSFEIVSLDHGDIHLLYKDQVEIVVERKTFQDVLSSIHDGRWSEQKLRAMSCLSTTRLFYIIELGNELWNDNFTKAAFKNFSSVSNESGFNAIINLFIVYNIPFLFVKNAIMTVEMIQLFCRQLEKKKDDHDLQASYEKSFIKSISGLQSKRKENLDSSMYYLHCLMGIPSISHKTATQIKTLFPTLQNFTEFIKNNSESELQKYWKTKFARKINANSVNFIYKVYGHEERTEVANLDESQLVLELPK